MNDIIFLVIFCGTVCFGSIGVSFVIQRKFFIHAKRKIFKLTPVIFSITLFLGGYIKYVIERYLLSRKSAVTMAYDQLDMEFFIYGMIIIPAIAGCILGLIVCKIQSKNKSV